MKRHLVILLAAFVLCLAGCQNSETKPELVSRSFYDTIWERFDYVSDKVTITEPTTFNLTMSISFTDDYPYNNFSMVFTVFDANDNPYRSKGYQFKLKDAEGQWNVQKTDDGCYTFELPINKSLQITEAGTYRFQIENRMPTTPLVGVKQLTLLNH